MSKLKAKKPEEVSPGHIKAIIFGEAGVGKTWFSLTFPKPYYIDSEGGARLAHYQKRLTEVGGAYLAPENGASDFDIIIEEIRNLTSEKHPYKTVIIDSLSMPYGAAIAAEGERILAKGNKIAFSNDKRPAVMLSRRLSNALEKIDMNVWIICHEKPKWKNGEQTGYEFDAWEKMGYYMNLILRVSKRAGKRFASVVKSRLTGFPEDDTFELTYEEVAARYGKDFIEAPVKPVALATCEQITEIKRLLEIVQVAEKEKESWNTKAKADNFEEYRADDLAKLIEYLKGKVK